MKLLLTICLLLSVIMPFSAISSINISKTSLKVDHHYDKEIFTANIFNTDKKNLIIKGNKQHHETAIYFYTSINRSMQLTYRIILPQNILFYDIIDSNDNELDTLYFLTKNAIYKFDATEKKLKKIIDVNSIYLHSENLIVSKLKFIDYINNDKLEDIILPGFDGVHLYLQNKDHSFSKHDLIKMPIDMRIKEGLASYESYKYYISDINKDKRNDIVFLKGNIYYFFYQKKNGLYSTKPSIQALGIITLGDDWESEIRVEKKLRDQSAYSTTRLHDVKDLNNDGTLDIITSSDIATGMFSRESAYHVHFGKYNNNNIEYSNKPNITMSSEGMQYFPSISDFNNDKLMDFIIPASKISIPKIIGILLSGSLNVDVAFYKQEKNNQFKNKPNIVKNERIDIDLKRGSASFLLIRLADIDGDNKKDLLLKKGKKKIAIFKGNSHNTLFTNINVEIETELPSYGGGVKVADLNNDKKEDLIIYYDETGLDGIEFQNTIKIIFML